MQKTDTFPEVKKYLLYLTKHRKAVEEAWLDLRSLVLEARLITEEDIEQVDRLIKNHDLSKYNLDEFEAYRQYYYPHPSERKNGSLLNQGWELHISRNLHHFENLKNYQGEDFKLHLIEMYCDWIAMSEVYGNSAEDYYASGQVTLTDEQHEFVEQLVVLRVRQLTRKRTLK